MNEWYEHAGDPASEDRWERFQKYSALPESHPSLDKFLADKGLVRSDLDRLGVRYTVDNGEPSLVYLFPDGIKYRSLASTGPRPRRWSEPGVEWSRCKIVRAQRPDAEVVVVAEGETDGALLSRLMPQNDIAILPAGATTVKPSMLAQLEQYTVVLAALDNDPAGNEGSQKILSGLPGKAKRLRPPDGHTDWCEAEVAGALSGWTPAPEEPPRMIFTFRDVVDADLGSTADNNWFSDDILPVGGLCIVHAPKKSLKSVLAIEMVRALTTGTAFAGAYDFINPAGPPKVGVFQMEIRPQAFQRRLLAWSHLMPASQFDAFLSNAFAYQIADNKLPRVKVTQPEFKGVVEDFLGTTGATVLLFDPLQRLTGEGDLDRANEMEKLLDYFAELQNQGITIIACHHNNKAAGKNARDPNAMTGTQRFGADADSICSVYHDPSCMIDDDNSDRLRQRNFAWTLRNGSAVGRSITVGPSDVDPDLMTVKFDQLYTKDASSLPSAGLPSIT